MIEIDNSILVLHNGVLYRSKISSLSSFLAIQSSIDAFEESIKELSGIVEYYRSEDFFEKYYTKADFKETFDTKENLINFENDATFVLSDTANAVIAGLSSQDQVSAWATNRFKKLSSIISSAYSYTARIWNNAKDLADAKDEALVDNCINPAKIDLGGI